MRGRFWAGVIWGCVVGLYVAHLATAWHMDADEPWIFKSLHAAFWLLLALFFLSQHDRDLRGDAP